MQDTFARVTPGQARATIGYLVYKQYAFARERTRPSVRLYGVSIIHTRHFQKKTFLKMAFMVLKAYYGGSLMQYTFFARALGRQAKYARRLGILYTRKFKKVHSTSVIAFY